MSANISAFSLIVFVGISVSWQALEVSNFKIPLRISSLFIFEKENGSFGCLLHTSHITIMLGWFLYFTTHFKTGSLILLARGSQLEYSAMLRLLTMFIDLTLSDKKGLIVFQSDLLSLILFSLRFPKYSDLDFSEMRDNSCAVLDLLSVFFISVF